MGRSGRVTSRLGLVCGVSALASLLVAFISGSWLYTDEPILLPNSTRLSFSIGITIGLWTVCPYMKKINTTLHFTSPTCSLIKYKKWDSLEHSNLEILDALDLAQVIVSRLRSCTVSCGSAIFFIILAVVLAILGHINNDKKILIACGIFILGGLSLGTGLVIFVTYLTETLIEMHPDKEPHFVYHYGWCFYLASTAFLFTNFAALLSILGYLETFPSVDEMVKHMVPGGKRKLQQNILKQQLPRQEYRQYDLLSNKRFRLHPECGGAITSDTPPDICTTSYCPPNVDEFGATSSQDKNYDESSMAGQTIPITIKNYSLPFSGIPVTKCEIFHHSDTSNSTSNIYQEITEELGQKLKNKRMKSETLQVFEPGLLNLSDKRTKKSFLGSAV